MGRIERPRCPLPLLTERLQLGPPEPGDEVEGNAVDRESDLASAGSPTSPGTAGYAGCVVSPVRIRHERQQDVEGIRAVHAAAFASPAEAELVDALRTSGHLTVSLAAHIGDLVIGHVGFSPLSMPGGVGLAPLAVWPAFQRHGIGTRLVMEGLTACRDLGHRFAVVLGEPAFYGRHGFETASHCGLTDEYGGGDAFQAVELAHDGVPCTGGLVRYAPEFAALADR